MTIGTQRGTLTRQYQIGDLVVSAATVRRGMTPADAQQVLDSFATPHAGLAKRLFAYGGGGLVEDTMTRACRSNESFAPILVWVALLLADHRIATAVEKHLTDGTGRLDPDRFNAEDLTIALDRMSVGRHPDKAASNILRYFETAGLVRARRHGSTVVGIDRTSPSGDVVPWVLMLIADRLPYIEGEEAVPSYRLLDFAVNRGVNRWLGMSAEDFREAAMGIELVPTPSVSELIDSSNGTLDGFKPKNDSDYESAIEASRITKSRLHETLVNTYATWSAGQGFDPSTPHPVDLMLGRGGSLWLVEAKVVYEGNATNAVRAVIGQVLTYRHMLYREAQPHLVGLFSEGIGNAYVELLEYLGIVSVWRDGDSWGGSPVALEFNLAEVT